MSTPSTVTPDTHVIKGFVHNAAAAQLLELLKIGMNQGVRRLDTDELVKAAAIFEDPCELGLQMRQWFLTAIEGRSPQDKAAIMRAIKPL